MKKIFARSLRFAACLGRDCLILLRDIHSSTRRHHPQVLEHRAQVLGAHVGGLLGVGRAGLRRAATLGGHVLGDEVRPGRAERQFVCGEAPKQKISDDSADQIKDDSW